MNKIGSILLIIISVIGILVGIVTFDVANIAMWGLFIAMVAAVFKGNRVTRLIPAMLLLSNVFAIFLANGILARVLVVIALIGSILIMVGSPKTTLKFKKNEKGSAPDLSIELNSGLLRRTAAETFKSGSTLNKAGYVLTMISALTYLIFIYNFLNSLDYYRYYGFSIVNYAVFALNIVDFVIIVALVALYNNPYINLGLAGYVGMSYLTSFYYSLFDISSILTLVALIAFVVSLVIIIKEKKSFSVSNLVEGFKGKDKIVFILGALFALSYIVIIFVLGRFTIYSIPNIAKAAMVIVAMMCGNFRKSLLPVTLLSGLGVFSSIAGLSYYGPGYGYEYIILNAYALAVAAYVIYLEIRDSKKAAVEA